MNPDQKKQYTIEVSEGEAEHIEKTARNHGVPTHDFIVSCIRAACFGFLSVIDRLVDQGQSGTRED
jgi:hypothetical protein